MFFLAGSLMVLGIIPNGHAANYALSVLPTRVQESNVPGVILALNVTGATTGITYKFTWSVTDPTGAAKSAINQTIAPASTFILSVAYPSNFGVNINYVGNYTINVQQNNPTNIPTVATGRFLVSLTDRPSYQRTFLVSVKARGYANNSPVTVNISHGATSASGYPTSVTTDGTGSLSTSWTIPANATLGVWTVTLTGSPAKAVADSQNFIVYPTNVTIGQLNLGQSSLQRTGTETFSFAANYLSGVPVQTGSATVQVTESDGTTSFSLKAVYNSTAALFRASHYLLPPSELGPWVASISPGGFDDGYGNGGPASSVVRGFSIQPAILTVIGTVPGQTFNVDDQIPLHANVMYPDGTPVTGGTITATFSANGTQVGVPIVLTYVQGQLNWAGVYTVKSTDPSGLWLVVVAASDPYGNTGQQTLSAIVSVPPIAPAPPPQKPVDTFYFLVVAIIMGSGGSGIILIRRINMGRASFDEFYKLTNGNLLNATTLLILGEAGSGVSTTGLALIYRQLLTGNHAGLLTYDTFPKEIERTMRGMDWDVSGHLKDGSFTILDCYSALAGNENAPIKDPIDFTEISIQVTDMIEKAGSKPILIMLDSITPIFNSAQSRTAVNFLRVLGAKVKNNQGILVLTGTRGSIPEEVRSNVDNMVDGVIELNMARDGEKLIRTLTVKRLTGRKVSAIPTEFDIVPGKGILFKKPRIPLKILTPSRKTKTFQ